MPRPSRGFLGPSLGLPWFLLWLPLGPPGAFLINSTLASCFSLHQRVSRPTCKIKWYFSRSSWVPPWAFPGPLFAPPGAFLDPPWALFGPSCGSLWAVPGPSVSTRRWHRVSLFIYGSHDRLAKSSGTFRMPPGSLPGPSLVPSLPLPGPSWALPGPLRASQHSK